MDITSNMGRGYMPIYGLLSVTRRFTKDLLTRWPFLAFTRHRDQRQLLAGVRFYQRFYALGVYVFGRFVVGIALVKT